MKNTLALIIALFICSTAFCSDKPSSTGDKKKAAEKTADTPVAKKQTPKIIVAATTKNTEAPKPKKESDGIVAPLSWRPVLVY